MADELGLNIKKVSLQVGSEIQSLFGRADEHRKLIEEALQVKLMVRDGALTITGPEEKVTIAERVIAQLLSILERGETVAAQEVKLTLRLFAERQEEEFRKIQSDFIEVSPKKHPVRPKGPGQRRYIEAIRKYDIVLGIGPAGTGKCVAGDTLVVTGEGLIPIEQLAGEAPPDGYRPRPTLVYGLKGPTWASHVYNGGESPTVRIRTRHGFRLEGTPEHPILVLTSEGEPHWRPLGEVRPGEFVALARGSNLFGREIRVQFRYTPHPHDHTSRPVTLDMLDSEFAYFMGLLVGDGSLVQDGRIIFSSGDPELRRIFLRTIERFGLRAFPNGRSRPYDLIVASRQLYALLLQLGLGPGKAHTKQVPGSILQAPRELVVAFLQGLFDTDGTVSRREGYPSLATASEPLASEVQLLLLNLGIVAHLRRKPASKRVSYILEMRGEEADRFFCEVGFRLVRKAALARPTRRNPNLDMVPYVARLLDTLIRTQTLSRRLHKKLYDYRTGRRAPSYAKLAEIVALFTVSHPCLDRLRWLLEKRFLWSEVTEVSPGRSFVYDLTVPDGHSFVAGGFMNHNTYLAMAMAVNALLKKQVSRIILTRPAVEAGEKLGYLPGTLYEKINPYLRPLYDALYDMIEADRANRLIEQGTIEIAPLAFMRGRTLNDAFIILDEAQNTTSEQMKMFLTRLGFGSKAVITGDITQVDLPTGKLSGLIEVRQILKDIPGIKFVHLSEEDVVRHELVSAIIRAYDSYQQSSEPRSWAPGLRPQRTDSTSQTWDPGSETQS